MSGKPIVVVGGGQAGFQLAASLRQSGYDRPILLVGDEGHLPYQRPPLSKGYLDDGKTPESLWFRPEAFLTANAIDFCADRRAVAIDRRDGRVLFADGSAVAYDRLVLATGTRNRPLPVPGADLAGVHGLRTIDDAHRMREAFVGAADVVVIGAGFIGLEIAATAAKRGLAVTVVEVAGRVMQRAVSPETSAFFQAAHEAKGVRFLLDSRVVRLIGEGGRVRAVETADGTRIPADVVVVGIGVIANQELAAEAGLAVGDGIAVDAFMATADPRIFAIGDCALHPSRYAAMPVRIESVQNAADQARGLAARLAGGPPETYGAVPWFWSDQGDLRLQIAGLGHALDRTVLRGDPAAGSYSLFGYRGGRLVSVESIARTADHMAARRLIAAGADVPPEVAADLSTDLKALALAAGRPG